MILPDMHTIVFLDIAVIIIHTVLAYLSKRLGEALKKPAYYKLYYIGIALIVVAVIVNTIALNTIVFVKPDVTSTVLMGLRCASGLLAVFASMQYWQWIFSELFKQ